MFCFIKKTHSRSAYERCLQELNQPPQHIAAGFGMKRYLVWRAFAVVTADPLARLQDYPPTRPAPHQPNDHKARHDQRALGSCFAASSGATPYLLAARVDPAHEGT